MPNGFTTDDTPRGDKEESDDEKDDNWDSPTEEVFSI